MDSAFTAAHRGGAGSPLVCLHGFLDTWRTWELVLPRLERRHDVLAPTLAGHAGGPPLAGPLTESVLPDAVEQAMDAAGFTTAHIVGNSLGGYVALQLAARGRARSVVAFAPAGGWATGAPAQRQILARQRELQAATGAAAAQAEAIVATPAGRRRATALITVHYEHIPAELLAHLLRGVAGAHGARAMIDFAETSDYPLDAERVTCPVRFAWGTEDAILSWPAAAARWRAQFPAAEWIVLDDLGHCPQIDTPLEAAELILGLTAS